MTTLRSKRVTKSEKKPCGFAVCSSANFRDLLFSNQGMTIFGESSPGGDGSYCREAEAGKLRTPLQFATTRYMQKKVLQVCFS